MQQTTQQGTKRNADEEADDCGRNSREAVAETKGVNRKDEGENICQRRSYDNNIQKWTANDRHPSEDHKKFVDRKCAGRLRRT